MPRLARAPATKCTEYTEVSYFSVYLYSAVSSERLTCGFGDGHPGCIYPAFVVYYVADAPLGQGAHVRKSTN